MLDAVRLGNIIIFILLIQRISTNQNLLRMKKLILFFLGFLFMNQLFSQLNGSFTIGTPQFPSLATAISELNLNGTTSGVTFYIPAGYTETFTDAMAGHITATGSATSPILFSKTGSGSNPLITAGPGTDFSYDGIIVLEGGDYITFDGIDLQENPLNTTPEMQMEFAYGLLKSIEPISGCQHITIRNCTVSLDRTYTSSTGIYGSNENLYGSSNILLTFNQLAAYNRFYNLTITDCYNGIKLLGYNSAGYGPEIFDLGIEIGKDGPITITNLGEGASSVRGINVNYADSVIIANTTIHASIGNGTTNYGIEATSGGAISMYNNTIDLLNPLYSKNFYAIYNTMGTLIGNKAVNIYNNTIKDIAFTPTTNITLVGIYNAAESDSINIYNNTVRSITKSGSGTIIGIYNLLTSTTGTEYIYSNNVYDISAPSATVYGIASSHSTFTNGRRKIHHNQVYNLQGNSTIYGIYCFVGGYADIYQNRVYNLSSDASSPNLHGVHCSSLAYKVNFYNNQISGLESPFCGSSSKVYGAYITGVDSILCSYNTVFLNSISSSALNFGNSCLFIGSIDFFELRNNNFVNYSTPTGSGIISAFATNESLASSAYSPNSGHNNFYAGIPSTSHLLVSSVDGFFETISTLQSIAAPAESGSISENPPFVNPTTAPYDLHLQTGIATLLESGGQRVTSPSIPIDYDSDTRWGESGYSGSGLSTDIGADEGDFTTFSLRPPIDFKAFNSNSVTNKISFTPLGSPLNNVVIVYNLTGIFTTPSGPPPTVGDAFAGGTLLFNGTTGSPITHTGLVFGTKYYYAAWSKNAVDNYSIQTNSAATAGIDAPTSIAATPAGSRQMSLQWTKNEEAHNILLVYSANPITTEPTQGTAYTAGDTWVTGETVLYAGSSTSYAQTGLLPYTMYYYKVWSIDELNYYSTSINTSKRTYYEAPYIQHFLASAGLPTEWTASGGFRQFNLNGVHNTYRLSNTIYPNTTSSVTSPNIQLTANPCRLLFDYRKMNTNDYPSVYSPFQPNDSLNVEISTDHGLTFQTIYSINASNHYNTTNYRGIIVDLSAWSNQVVMLRFKAINSTNFTSYWIDIDDVIVEETPSCAYPALPLISSLSYNSASFTWQGAGSNWQLEYGPSGFVHGTGVYLNGVISNTATLTGLSGSTTYDVYVRKDCGAGVFSDWSDYASFTTRCNPIVAPYEEFFASDPLCWYMDGAEPWYYSTGSYINNDPIDDHTSGGGGKFAIVYGSLNDPLLQGITLYSPYIDVSALTNVQLKFYLYRNSTIGGDNNQTLNIDYWDGLAWHAAVYSQTIVASTTTGWQEVNVYLNEIEVAGPVQFRFIVNRNGGNSYQDMVVIDDIYVQEGPVCPPPQNITFSNITPNSAQVNWTQAGSPSLWDFEYGLDPFTLGSGSLLSNHATNQLNLTSLSASSTYHVNIRTNCGTTYSDWVSSEIFATPCEAVTSLWTEGFEMAAFPPTCWDTVHIDVNNQWQLSTEAGGYGNSTSSMMVNFFSWFQTSEIETWPFDVASLGTVQFKFDYAYATFVNEVDQLDIYYSTDYGATYSLLENMPGGLTGILNTAGSTTDIFIPLAGDWQTHALTLPIGTNRIKFKGISAAGNQLYIDNVRVEGLTSGSKVLSLKLFLQGLYAGASVLNKAQGISGDAFSGSIADKITVELHSASSYSTIVYSASDINLNTDGTASIPIPDALTSSYYVKVAHRNSLSIVSALPLSFSGNLINYDFSTASTKAYGNNIGDLGGGIFGLYNGDVNQDGVIDALDLISIDNAASVITNGYNSDDVNGDGIVNLADIILTESNATAFKAVITP